jgi:acetylornithine deacetylase/succinyl-diaminopimelate desuccinylase-like protein
LTLLDAARVNSLVMRERLADLVCSMVDIASPSGEELELATWCCSTLADLGVSAVVQPIDHGQANAYATLPGSGGGRSLLLYAPIDTVGAGNAAEDLPWMGDVMADHLSAGAVRDGQMVVGLGASNPKGHAACVLAAFEAIARSGVKLSGDVVVAFGAGGMPTGPRPVLGSHEIGHGRGCEALLEHFDNVGARPDAAVIAKPGWNVSYEEVGFIWFEMRVGGSHSYVGSRHRIEFRSAIADAALAITALEAWFVDYSKRHTSGTVAPQGVVGAIESGWWRMPAFTGALCRFMVDLRLSPRTPAAVAIAEFNEALDAIRAAHPGIDIAAEAQMVFEGVETSPDHAIVTTAVDAWESVVGARHQFITGNSGSTDAVILRAHGIPTVRMGMAKVDTDAVSADFQLGMNTVDLAAMEELTHMLIATVLRWCQ